MTSFLQRMFGASSSSNLDLAMLQLRLLVAMAAADDRIGELEVIQIEDFIDRASRSERDHDRLHQLFAQLVDVPPSFDDVLEELSRHSDRTNLGRRMVQELAILAESDDAVDHREELLLDLVCETFGLEPLDLADDEQPDVHELMRELAEASRRVA